MWPDFAYVLRRAVPSATSRLIALMRMCAWMDFESLELRRLVQAERRVMSVTEFGFSFAIVISLNAPKASNSRLLQMLKKIKVC